MRPPSAVEELYTSTALPLLRLTRTYHAPVSMEPLGGVDGEAVGVGFVGGVLLRALRVEVYAAFLLPEESNSSGFWPVRQESLSRMPHTVMPLQRATARQARVTVSYT